MEKKDDDNIEIDFGKFKSFFKSEKKDVAAKEPQNVEIKEGSDDEISIDFGKFRNFFKGKKAEETIVSSKEISGGKIIEEVKVDIKDKNDDEIQIDFKKIKNIFTPDAKEEKEQRDEDISINWSSVGSFFKKYGVIFLALIPIIISIYVRMQAGILPITDEWATSAVIGSVQTQINSQVAKSYPNLPDANRQEIINAEMNKFIGANKEYIDQEIAKTSQFYKSFFLDESGKNYMPDIDPYYWLRYTQNIVDHGYPGDIIRDGVQIDDHQLAPAGRPVAADMFHAYYLAYFWKASSMILPSLSVERSIMYSPVIGAALCVLLVFLIARKIAGNTAGFFAGMLMAVNSAFLVRTLFGHSDTDIWVVFFPLLATWMFIESFGIKNPWKVAFVSALAGISTAVFSFAWTGWWFIFDFLLATIFVTLVYLIIVNFREIRKNAFSLVRIVETRNLIIFGLVYFITSAIFVTLIMSWVTFVTSFMGPLSFPSIKAPVGQTTLWPNVLTTVAELNEGSIGSAINSIGGRLFFFISMLGLALAVTRKDGLRRIDYFFMLGTGIFYALYFLYRKSGSDSPVVLALWVFIPIGIWIFSAISKKQHDYDFHSSILLALWIVATVFASIKGIRFTLLMAPAVSVAFGVAFGNIYRMFSAWSSSGLRINKMLGGAIIFILLSLAFISPTKAAIQGAGRDIPLINDAWYSALVKIRDNSKPDAIITSWWDFGHHFKSIADRKVTFDGTTQATPPAHWVGKILMETDEERAVAMLRMLDCGSSTSFSMINRVKNDFIVSKKIFDQLIWADKKDAEDVLRRNGFDKEAAENIVNRIHCNPPEAFFIASEDMIGKSGVWSHFGSWNFERAEIWQKVRSMDQDEAVDYLMTRFNYTPEAAESTYFDVQSISTDSEANTWIAPWPGYGGTAECSRNEEGLFACSNGFVVNMTSQDIYGISQQGISRPKIAAFTTKDGMKIKKFEGTTVDFGATIIPQSENNLLVVLSSKELAGSMFTRMFYMQGHGLKYFKPFDHQRGLTGTDIYVYKVDWNAGNKTIVAEYANALANISLSK